MTKLHGVWKKTTLEMNKRVGGKYAAGARESVFKNCARPAMETTHWTRLPPSTPLSYRALSETYLKTFHPVSLRVYV